MVALLWWPVKSVIFSNSLNLVAGAATPLGVKDNVGEVLLFGFGAEVVVSNAVPVEVKNADETNDDEQRQADAKTGDACYVESAKSFL